MFVNTILWRPNGAFKIYWWTVLRRNVCDKSWSINNWSRWNSESLSVFVKHNSKWHKKFRFNLRKIYYINNVNNYKLSKAISWKCVYVWPSWVNSIAWSHLRQLTFKFLVRSRMISWSYPNKLWTISVCLLNNLHSPGHRHNDDVVFNCTIIL